VYLPDVYVVTDPDKEYDGCNSMGIERGLSYQGSYDFPADDRGWSVRWIARSRE
jgi:hypothetical protein